MNEGATHETEVDQEIMKYYLFIFNLKSVYFFNSDNR